MCCYLLRHRLLLGVQQEKHFKDVENVSYVSGQVSFLCVLFIIYLCITNITPTLVGKQTLGGENKLVVTWLIIGSSRVVAKWLLS